MSYKKLGVIGGMGPAATAYFFELLIKLADASVDQEHLETYIISRPSIPDRTAFITGMSGESPVPPIIEAGRALVSLGADFIAIPCVTAHFFFDELAAGIGAPVIDMVGETAARLKDMGIKRAGLMAADGTISGGIFNKELESRGIGAVIPSARMQARVMDLIYSDVKANKPPDFGAFMSVADELAANGAEAVVLACTELSLVKRDHILPGMFVDALELLALRSLERCGVGSRWSGRSAL